MSEHEQESPDPLLEEQRGKGYGEDEGEREPALDESADDE
jgi:hypothetical protein